MSCLQYSITIPTMLLNLQQKWKRRGGFWCMCAADGEVSFLDHRVT
jgi:hypothetical protein